MDLSIIVPAYNEEENIVLLHRELSLVLSGLNKKYEIIFINDGSNDSTLKEMLQLKEQDLKVKIISFKKNFGQTAAWDAGFRSASGRLIIVMDADLQNDPRDIPRLIQKLDEGYDVVSGWRYKRNDTLSKRLFSFFANKLRRSLTGEKIHDSGCSLKIYKRECLQKIKLYGEMHRYITAILSWKGYRIGEIKVNHNPRKHGKTKYSFSRLFRGMMDLIIITFWQRYSTRPIHFFGGIGFFSLSLGSLITVYLVFIRLFLREPLSNRPLLLLAILLIISGIQLLLFGILADICLKIYSKDEETYLIDQKIMGNGPKK